MLIGDHNLSEQSKYYKAAIFLLELATHIHLFQNGQTAAFCQQTKSHVSTASIFGINGATNHAEKEKEIHVKKERLRDFHLSFLPICCAARCC